MSVYPRLNVASMICSFMLKIGHFPSEIIELATESARHTGQWATSGHTPRIGAVRALTAVRLVRPPKSWTGKRTASASLYNAHGT